jgi:hypothetical protein
MAELGQTGDPTALIPGDPDSLQRTIWSLRAYGDLLNLAGEGLARIDTGAGWEGTAGDAFRAVYHGQPGKWLTAGDAFHDAASAVESYAGTLNWAQEQAANAIRLWASGTADHQAAQDMLASARDQLNSAGNTAATKVGAARDLAPPNPSLWSRMTSDVGSFLSATGHVAKDVGQDALTDLASLGNAALHDPGSVATTVGGLLLTGVSGLGEGGGVLLDATGLGAIVGVPLNAVSALGVATGLGLAGAGAANIVHDAMGPDRVNMSSDGNGGSGGVSKRDIHGSFRNSYRGVDVQNVWDNGDMYIQGDGQIVKVLDNGNGTSDIVIRDMSNPSAQPTTVIKGATQKYIDGKIESGAWA